MVGEDELKLLREEAERVEKEAAEKKEVIKEKEKDKKKKRKKSQSSSSGRKEKKLRIRAKKPVDELFKDTGLDPQPKVRRKILRMAKRKTKKRKKQRKGSSQSSDSSSSSGDQPGGALGGVLKKKLFTEDTMVEELAESFPGVLTAGWISAAREHLLQLRGEDMEEDEGKVPPVGMRRVRMQLHGRMSPPMQREAATLAKVVDHLLGGRPSETCDVAVQRLKSLEAVANGVHYSIANRMQSEKSMATSTAETWEAAKRVAQEEKILQKAAKPGGKGWESQQGKGSGKQGKGKNEKGKGKDGKSKGDSKQAEKKDS